MRRTEGTDHGSEQRAQQRLGHGRGQRLDHGSEQRAQQRLEHGGQQRLDHGGGPRGEQRLDHGGGPRGEQRLDHGGGPRGEQRLEQRGEPRVGRSGGHRAGAVVLVLAAVGLLTGCGAWLEARGQLRVEAPAAAVAVAAHGHAATGAEGRVDATATGAAVGVDARATDAEGRVDATATGGATHAVGTAATGGASAVAAVTVSDALSTGTGTRTAAAGPPDVAITAGGEAVLTADAPAVVVERGGVTVDGEVGPGEGRVTTAFLPGFGPDTGAAAVPAADRSGTSEPPAEVATPVGGSGRVGTRAGPGGGHVDPRPGAGWGDVDPDAPAGSGAGAAGEGSPGHSRLEAEIEARARVARGGVASLGGRPADLAELLGAGVQVDGVRIRLADLARLSAAAPAPQAGRLPTDAALTAWAEAVPVDRAATGPRDVVVQLRGGELADAARAPLRVHLVIDRSSSMQRSWPRVRQAARALLARLLPTDELQVVAYGSSATEVLPLGPVGDRRRASVALGSIAVGGGTDLEAGLSAAYDAVASASAGPRTLVLLLSDGVPNRGAFEPAELEDLAASARVRSGATTSVIGLGVDFDAQVLRAIARGGRGDYHIAADLDELEARLTGELEAHARAAARRVEVEVASAEPLELRSLETGAAVGTGRVTLSLPALDAGEERRLVVRTAGPGPVTVRVRYRSAASGLPVEARLHLAGEARASSGAGDRALDAGLAAALDAASRAVLHGEAEAAGAALRAHAAQVARAAGSPPRHGLRVRAPLRLATALEAFVPAAPPPSRRRVSLALGGLAARFGR
ncbi:MAG: VWA domain-containing protein [Sandaracinaceae bacterium]